MKIKNAKIIIICFIFLCSTIIIAFLIQKYNFKKYQQAHILFENEEYKQAERIYSELGNYKDSKELKEDMANYAVKLETYTSATNLLNQKKYNEAIEAFEEIINFKDSAEKLKEAKYNFGIEYYENNDYENAKKIFVDLDGYLNSTLYLAQINIKLLEQSQEIIYQKACDYYENKNYNEAFKLFEDISNYKDSQFKAKKCRMWNLSSTILAGLHHSAAIKDDGKIICTDSRYVFTEWDNVISISGFGAMIIGLNEDGTVKLEGHPDRLDVNGTDIWYRDISDWEDIVQISSGQQHVVGLKDDGTVVSAGLLTSPDWENIELIATGWGYTVGLDSNNIIHVNGSISDKLSTAIDSSKGRWNNIIAIDAGGANSSKVNGKGHIVGLYEDGTVIAIGDNHYGQCNVYGEEWTDIVAIAAGDFHTVGLKSDGTVVATVPLNTEELPSSAACNVYGEEWTDIVAIAAGCGTTLGLKSNGSIVSCGYDRQNQIPNTNDKDWNNIKIKNK